MQYVAFVEGEELQIEVRELDGDSFLVDFGEGPMEISARVLGDTSLSLIIDHEVYDIESELTLAGAENLLVRGNLHQVEVLDLRKVRLRQAKQQTGLTSGPAEIVSPMPGKVVSILAPDGTAVKIGDGVIVVEAMKMENELKAPRDGIVRKIHCSEGDAVEAGVALCVIEQVESD